MARIMVPARPKVTAAASNPTSTNRVMKLPVTRSWLTLSRAPKYWLTRIFPPLAKPTATLVSSSTIWALLETPEAPAEPIR